MPLTYETPPAVRAALEEALAASPDTVLARVLAAVAGLGVAADAGLTARLRAVVSRRSRGPADLWGEVVDALNAAEGEGNPA